VTKPIRIGEFTFDPNSPKVQIEEISLFKDKFKLTTDMLTKRLKEEVKNMKFGKDYNDVIKEVKENINFFIWRYLDVTAPLTKKSGRKGYYSEEGLEEIKRRLNTLRGIKTE
jgi:hypothetical protein